MTTISDDGAEIEVEEIPRECWGTTPYRAVGDGWLFVEYLVSTGPYKIDLPHIYRATDEEQDAFAAGRLDLVALCERLVGIRS